MVVTASNLFSESYTQLRSHLNTQLTDPKTNSTSSRRRWIYRDFPDTTSHQFSGYPFIVINHADVTEEALTLNGLKTDDEISFNIEIYVEFNDENARADSLSDAVYTAIMSDANQTLLQTQGLYNPALTSRDVSLMDMDRKRVVVALFGVTFRATICRS